MIRCCFSINTGVSQETYNSFYVVLQYSVVILSRQFWSHLFSSSSPTSSAVDEGGRDGNPDPDRGPQSVCASQHRPHWGAAEEKQSESNSFLSVSLNDCYMWSCRQHLALMFRGTNIYSRSPVWSFKSISNRKCFSMTLLCFVLLQIREQNRFDVMTSGPRSQHLAGIPVDAPRQVRISSLWWKHLNSLGFLALQPDFVLFKHWCQTVGLERSECLTQRN